MKFRLVVVLLVSTVAAQAAALEPKRASEIVRVEGGLQSNTCVNPFSPGLVVPSGGSVCVNNSDGATETGAMSGYFAKDK